MLGVVLNGTPASGVGSDYYGGGYGADGGSYDVYYQAPRDAAEAAAGSATMWLTIPWTWGAVSS